MNREAWREKGWTSREREKETKSLGQERPPRSPKEKQFHQRPTWKSEEKEIKWQHR